jgi:hypothetical protein
MMPKSVKRFSDDIMLYLFSLDTDSDFGSIRPEIRIRVGQRQACLFCEKTIGRHG